jgi:hypothetical protein
MGSGYIGKKNGRRGSSEKRKSIRKRVSSIGIKKE